MHFDIGKQKVVWILKYKERDEKAAENALSRWCFSRFIYIYSNDFLKNKCLTSVYG